MYSIAWQFYFNAVQHEQHPFIFLALAVLFPFYSIGANFSYHITGLKKFRERTLFELMMHGVTIGAAYGSYILTQDIFILTISLLLSQAILCNAYLFVLIRRASTRVDHEAATYGRKLNRNYIIPILKAQIDRVLVSNLLGFEKTGIYSVAASLSDQLTTTAKTVGALTMPKSANLTQGAIREKLTVKTMGLVLFLFLAIAVILALLAPFLITTIYGQEFVPAIPFAQVMLLFIPLRSFSLVIRSIHESQKNTRIIGLMSNQMAVIEVGLMVIGLLAFGIWGLIFARIIADLSGLILQLIFIYKPVPES